MATASANNSRPVQVTWAVRVLWAALFVAVIAAIPEYLEPPPPDSGLSHWSVWSLLAFVFAFWALITLLIGRRHNWARVVTLILFIAGLALSVWEYEYLFDRPTYSIVIEVVEVVMTGVALYWLFTEPAASWFRKSQPYAP